MNAGHVTPEESDAKGSPGASTGVVSRFIIAAADANEVMREQLEFLIEHAESGTCGCPQCQRYLRARAVLMEIFAA